VTAKLNAIANILRELLIAPQLVPLALRFQNEN
jgi:hypothetical protein